MIAKVEVRRQLALYENKIREEIQNIREDIKDMDNACGDSMQMKRIWLASEIYAKLNTKLTTLNCVLSDIIDMRCSEIFED